MLNSINTNRIQTIPTFRSVQEVPAYTQSNVTAPDTVEIAGEVKTGKKKKKSTLSKVLIGVGAGIATLVTAGVLISKHQTQKITKLYKENLVLSELAEHIEFKEAQSIEEGIKFAQEVLKIPQVDSEFTLEAINTANKGLVDVSNAHKGKLFMPRGLHFVDWEESTLAGVYREIDKPTFGHLAINKKWFDNDFLNKKLDKLFQIREFAPKTPKPSGVENASQPTEKVLTRQDLLEIEWSDEFKSLANKYRKNANSITLTEKRKLLGMYSETNNEFTGIFDRNPLAFIKKNINLFEGIGISVNIDEISKLSTKEQTQKLIELLKQSYENGNSIVIKSSDFIQEKTIYHEMGHLQDFAENLKNLDLANWKKLNFKEVYKDVKAGKDRGSVEEIDNHWGALTKGNFKKLLDENPEKFKKLYPDMYEFVTNEEYQRIAGTISGYAQVGIGEFIAEAYAQMIKTGKKLPDEVMTLYKKYNGPIPPKFE